MFSKDPETELYRRCVDYWNAMSNEAFDDHGDSVWSGHVTKIFPDRTNYILPIRALTEMGCIRCIMRGNRRDPTRYHLRKAPTPELFRERVEDPRDAGHTRAELYRMIRDLRDRVDRLEEARLKGD